MEQKSSPPRRLRVLFATDEMETRSALVPALRADGHAVVSAAGPTELVFAIEVVCEHLGPMPDLLVLDVDMRQGAVLDVLNLYGAKLAEVPVLLLLGANAEEMSVHPGLDYHTVGVFHKPLDLDDLRTAIANLEVWKRAARARRARDGRARLALEPGSDPGD